MENMIQKMNQLKSFMQTFNGNAQEQAMNVIKQAGIPQKDLNDIQQQASAMYEMGQRMGFIR